MISQTSDQGRKEMDLKMPTKDKHPIHTGDRPHNAIFTRCTPIGDGLEHLSGSDGK